MFTKIEVLDKKKHKSSQFDIVDPKEVAKNIGSIPLGFSEVLEMAHFCPVIISGDEKNLEFVAFSGVSSTISIFSKGEPYLPWYVQAYPFMNAVLIDPKGLRQDVIGIEVSKVGKGKEYPIFEKGELFPIAKKKIELVQELNRQRDISKKIIQELQKYDLLQKKDFKVNFEETTKVILEKFYVADREKLVKLPDDVLALWAKKGWITLFDTHLKSITNFRKFFVKI